MARISKRIPPRLKSGLPFRQATVVLIGRKGREAIDPKEDDMKQSTWIINEGKGDPPDAPEETTMRGMIPLDDPLVTEGLIEHTNLGWRVTAKGKAAHVVMRDARYPPGTDPVWLEQHLAGGIPG